ncbi:unnamed protein product [Amoebophrya sp. A120]|nr:unnamed protein product [Amoebophrya sp. A120]|eukprot:GSA120T00000180001.1
MTHSGNDRFFHALLRNDAHPLTLKHTKTALPTNRPSTFLNGGSKRTQPPARGPGSGAAFVDGVPETRTPASGETAQASKHSMLSAQSAACIASRMSTMSTRGKPRFVPGLQSKELLKMEHKTQDFEYMQRRREEKLQEIQRLKQELQRAKQKEMQELKLRYQQERQWREHVKSLKQQKDSDVRNFRRSMQKEDQEMRRDAELLMREFEHEQAKEEWQVRMRVHSLFPLLHLAYKFPCPLSALLG